MLDWGAMTRSTAVLRAAEAAHEVNRAYCAALGDTSQPAWADAPDWQRDSVVAGVQAIVDNPDMTPEQAHAGWLARKRADGWVYGPVKDTESKTHPCMVAYFDLPVSQRVKDALFGATVLGVLSHYGVGGCS